MSIIKAILFALVLINPCLAFALSSDYQDVIKQLHVR